MGNEAGPAQHIRRILIVDDDHLASERYVRCFADAGFSVQVVTSLEDARAAISNGDFDAAILELGLPDGDGYWFLEELRRLPRQPHIVVISRSLTSTIVFRLFESGIVCIAKPLGADAVRTLATRLEFGEPNLKNLQGFCRQYRLSNMQQRVLVASAAGLTKQETADLLKCSLRTIEGHWTVIFRKVGIHCTDGVLAALLRAVASLPAEIGELESGSRQSAMRTSRGSRAN